MVTHLTIYLPILIITCVMVYNSLSSQDSQLLRNFGLPNFKYLICTCSAPVAFITTFVTLFALVIAITKDLPDVEGDRR